MHHSITFERKDRLLTGLKLELITSKPCFFSRGLTTAVSQLWMNSPSPKETFTILVISDMAFGNNSLKIVVGIASSLQDLLLSEVITCHTSFSVIGANLESFGTPDGSV